MYVTNSTHKYSGLDSGKIEFWLIKKNDKRKIFGTKSTSYYILFTNLLNNIA